MSARATKLVVHGVDHSGNRFRPSDWVERISTIGAGFGPDHRLRYSKALHPDVIDGEKCLVVETSLREENRALYEHIMRFIRQHELCVDGDPLEV